MSVPDLRLVNGRLSAEGVNKVETTHCIVYWHGYIYIDGYHGQHQSVEVFVESLASVPIEDAVKGLKGSFLCFIEHDNGTYHAFVDNSGMYAAYECDRGVSRSFLTLVDDLELRVEDLDWASVAEFVQTNNLYFQNTLFAEIKKIGFDQILQFEPDGKPCIRLKKNVPDICDQPETASLQDSFVGFANAVQGMSISVDVTGGLDTRTLIAGLHAADVTFETAVSGADDHADVQIARQVASSIGRECFVTSHDISDLSGELQGTLESLDGLKAHLLTQHRINQLQHERDRRGVQLCLRGVGGEQFRDFKWAQDFPFYRSRTIHLERFDRMRVEVVRVPINLFSERFKTYLDMAREQRLLNYRRYRQRLNTETYDMIDCHETLQNSHSRAMSISATSGMAVFCPLSEVHRLQHAYRCPRSLRFGALFQKRFITRGSRSLARVVTTYGATASSELSYLLTGSAVLLLTNTKKLIRKLSQTYLGRSPFKLATPTLPGSTEALRQSTLCDEAFAALVRHQIVASDVTKNDVSDRFIERLVCLGWFLNRLDTKVCSSTTTD